MREIMVTKRCARLLAIGLIASATIALLAGPKAAPAATEQPKNPVGFVEKIRDLQDRMSQKFHDTWQGLWKDKEAKSLTQTSVSTASIDLREQSDSYTVRMNLPNRDLSKVEVTLSGDTLHVSAPAAGSTGQYQQDIVLDGIAASAQPKIERKQQDNMIVVTVPKSAQARSTASHPRLSPFSAPTAAWDRDVLARMEQMQQEMDRLFNEAFDNAGSGPAFDGFFDNSRFGSSVDLQEEDGNKYVVRAYLPDRDMDNINVSTEGRTLKIEAKSEENEKKNQNSGYMERKSHYSQILTLPGPVDAAKVKVDRQQNMLIVTLPKATSG